MHRTQRLAAGMAIALVWLSPPGVDAHPHDSELTGTAHEIEHGAELFLDGDVAAAVPILEQSIRALEADGGPDQASLVIPLGFLGSSYFALDRHAQALETLARARRLSQAADGPTNAHQLPLVYVEAAALQALGRVEEAEQKQREALEISQQNYGETSMEASIALGRLAEWMSDNGDYEQSLILFSRALDHAQQAAGGDDSPDMLPLLQGMAQVFLAEGWVPGRALPLVRRMVELTENHPDRFDPPTRIEAHLLFGDLLMRFSLEKEALEAYRSAWGVARDADDQDWLARLAAPQKVAGSLNPVDDRPADQEYFVFRYDLADDGRPTRVYLVESNAEPVVSRWALQRFRDVRFRPPLVDGQPRALAQQSTIFVY